MAPPFRLGFAVKILAGGGMRTSDTRRWQSGPHLSRSIELLDAAFDHLHASGMRVFRMSSSTIPYGTHPDLPQLDYRRQLADCEHELAALGEKPAALERFERSYELLSDRARARLAVEHDERLFDVADVLALHGRLGCTAIYDHHHHRCNPAPDYEHPATAIEAICATWPPGIRSTRRADRST